MEGSTDLHEFLWMFEVTIWFSSIPLCEPCSAFACCGYRIQYSQAGHILNESSTVAIIYPPQVLYLNLSFEI